MSKVIIKFKRELNIDELQEVLEFAKIQETTDRETNTIIDIYGDFGKITVKVDEDGDFTVL